MKTEMAPEETHGVNVVNSGACQFVSSDFESEPEARFSEVEVVPYVTGLLCTSKCHHGLFPSFHYRGCSVGELPRTSTLCLTTDGSSRKCRLGSDVEIPVWRYPVGGKTRVLHRSRGATFCYYGMGYLFWFLLWYT